MTDACIEKVRWGGFEALTGDFEQCYKFDPPRRWKGLWFGEFEGSRFCPDPASECSDDSPGESIWLTTGKSVHFPEWKGDTGPVLYAVDFVGHKTSFPGHYGHMGMSNQEIVVDRLISITRIEVPRKK